MGGFVITPQDTDVEFGMKRRGEEEKVNREEGPEHDRKEPKTHLSTQQKKNLLVKRGRSIDKRGEAVQLKRELKRGQRR